jgi:hypothetical protein
MIKYSEGNKIMQSGFGAWRSWFDDLVLFCEDLVMRNERIVIFRLITFMIIGIFLILLFGYL